MKKLKTHMLLLMILSLSNSCSHAQEKEVKGDLYFVSETFIAPENITVFKEYNKAYKKLADEKNGPEYFVNHADGSYRFGAKFGTEMSDLADFYKKWGEWSAEPDVKALNDKFQYTEDHYNVAIWRHSPELSYSIKGDSKDTVTYQYRRYTEYYVKTDKVDEFKNIIKEYIAEYTKLGVDVKITCFWNLMGREAPCLMVVDYYIDEENWVLSKKKYEEHTKENEKITELSKRFLAVLRKSKDYEGYYVKNLSHYNSEK